jgi:uncharacterized lipoprotein YddW (UPF0748 family)
MKRLILLAALSAFWGASCTIHPPAHHRQQPPPSPKPSPTPAPKPAPTQVTELRGVWVSNTTRLDWADATRRLQKNGFNAMYVNLASGGAAFYPDSRVVPSLVGQDDIARGISIARQRGIAVHAKLICFFMFKAPPEFQKRLIREGRVMRDDKGAPALQNTYAWLCPSQPANRALLNSLVTEMLTRYPVDGLHYDYIRFYEQPSCYCPHCRQTFESAAGLRVKRWPADVMGGANTDEFLAWKRNLITDAVRDLTATARRLRPGLPISAAVFQNLDQARIQKAQDWKLWLERNYVNYVATMTYTTNLADFEERVRNQQGWGPRNRVAIGIGSYKCETMSTLWSQINIVRRQGAPGFVLFSWDDCDARDFLPNLNASR